MPDSRRSRFQKRLDARGTAAPARRHLRPSAVSDVAARRFDDQADVDAGAGQQDGVLSAGSRPRRRRRKRWKCARRFTKWRWSTAAATAGIPAGGAVRRERAATSKRAMTPTKHNRVPTRFPENRRQTAVCHAKAARTYACEMLEDLTLRGDRILLSLHHCAVFSERIVGIMLEEWPIWKMSLPIRNRRQLCPQRRPVLP